MQPAQCSNGAREHDNGVAGIIPEWINRVPDDQKKLNKKSNAKSSRPVLRRQKETVLRQQNEVDHSDQATQCHCGESPPQTSAGRRERQYICRAEAPTRAGYQGSKNEIAQSAHSED